jgi:hypothetical protein
MRNAHISRSAFALTGSDEDQKDVLIKADDGSELLYIEPMGVQNGPQVVLDAEDVIAMVELAVGFMTKEERWAIVSIIASANSPAIGQQ